MAEINEAAVMQALSAVQEPELGKDIVTLDMVKELVVEGSNASLMIELTTPACPLKDVIERDIRGALDGIGVQLTELRWGRRCAAPLRRARRSFCRTFVTSLQSPQGRAALGRAPSPSISPLRLRRAARASDFLMRTSRDQTFRRCLVQLARRSQAQAERSNRSSATV